MPMTLDEFKRAWEAHFKRLEDAASEVAEADTRQDDSTVSSTDAFLAMQQAWKDKKVDTWPRLTKTPCVKLKEAGQAKVRARDHKGARVLYETLTKEILALDELKTESEVAMKATARKKSYRTASLAAWPIDDRESLGDDARARMERARALFDQAHERNEQGAALHAEGDYAAALRVFDEADSLWSEMLTIVRSEQFFEDTTIQLNQATFKSGDDEAPLLIALGSQGVCQALVLDFLSGGGSGGTPGEPVEGQITGTHLKAQATYRLETLLGSHEDQEAALERMKKAQLEDISTVADQISTSTNNLAWARERLAEARQLKLANDEELAVAERKLRLKLGEQDQVKGMPDFPGKTETLEIVASRVETLTEIRDRFKEIGTDNDEDISRYEGLVEGYTQALERLERDKTSLESEVDGLRKQMARIVANTKRLTEEFQANRKGDGAPIPSVLLDSYGVSFEEGKLVEKKPAAGKFLTGDEVQTTFVSRLDQLEDGDEVSLNVAVRLEEGGHAIALRAKRGTPWDIEFFDPNANGYRFADYDKFKAFLPKFYKTFYAAKWKDLSLATISVSGEREGTTDTGSLLGPSVLKAYTDDCDRLDELVTRLIGDDEFPKKLGDELAAKVLTAYNKLPANSTTATEIDLKIARNYLEDVNRELSQILDLSAKYAEKLEEARAALRAAGDKDRNRFAEAVSKHHDGKLAEATKMLARLVDGLDQNVARDAVDAMDLTREPEEVIEDTADHLDALLKNLRKAGQMVIVPDRDALVAAFARELNMSLEVADQRIATNQGRGFTAPTGTVYIQGGNPETAHDSVHETVHLMSAPGGATQIMANYGEQLNEGFTEYFTKQMCRQLGVPDAQAYVAHVAFITRLAPVVGENLLYKAYMQNNGMDGVLDKLVDVWVGKNDGITNGAFKVPKVRGSENLDLVRAKETINNKFKNSFPPEGPMMKFWDQGVLS